MRTTTTTSTTTLTPMMMMTTKRILLESGKEGTRLLHTRDGEEELCRNCRKDEEEARDGVKVQMVEISGNKAQVEEREKEKLGPLKKE